MYSPIPPFGYSITYANTGREEWLVMRWGEIVQVCESLTAAYEWLLSVTDDSDVRGR